MKEIQDEVWEYRAHTRVKHTLLQKYLRVWIIKLGAYHRKVLFFDCFAGRGEYKDPKTNESIPGSPIIAIRVASDLLDQCEKRGRKPYFDEFICTAIEKSKKNFNNLRKLISLEEIKLREQGRENKIRIFTYNDEFANVANKILEVGDKIAPSFFFIDPFGFSGVPFEVIKKILSLPRTEIFLTFMTQSINRFLTARNAEGALTGLFSTTEWQEIIGIQDWKEREQRLLNLYIKSLREETDAKHILPFRVCMEKKHTTLYYLIHVTKHFDGLKIMKDVMRNASKSGELAWLGREELLYEAQKRLFELNLQELKDYLMDIYRGKCKTFREILLETYEYNRFLIKEYQKALRELQKEGKVMMGMLGPRGGIKEDTEIKFLSHNHNKLEVKDTRPFSPPISKIRVYWKEYQLLDGSKRSYVWKVNDGSIISRFDKTPLPEKDNDIVCPHFLELKWAYGCPYDCAWCYLKGTLRFQPRRTTPVVKDYEKIRLHIQKFFEEVDIPEILNTGEIADSLMYENVEMPFSKFIIPLFETQNKHKVLFLTKSTNINNLLGIKHHKQTIISFSLNALPVAERWEKAPPVLERIKAAKCLWEAGYEVRIRIDPIVPIDDWKKHYLELLRLIFDNLIPERITLGSLRGLQSTINGCSDKSWVGYLIEGSNWGRRVNFSTRNEMYSIIIQALIEEYNFYNIGLCKETLKVWNSLNLDYRKIKCNCIW